MWDLSEQNQLFHVDVTQTVNWVQMKRRKQAWFVLNFSDLSWNSFAVNLHEIDFTETFSFQ